MQFEYFSKDGNILPIAEAVVPISNIEYSYGFGVYETLRVVNGTPYFLSQHVTRLAKSALTIGLEHEFANDFFEKSVHNLVSKYQDKTFNIKILLIGAPNPKDTTCFMLALNPLFPDKKIYRDGISLITYNYERPFHDAKTLNMLQSYIAYSLARKSGAYDALLTDNNGNATEGTRTNFFCIKDRTIYSPPTGKILKGVMRSAILHVAMSNDFRMIEQDIPLTSITQFDGAFISSTSSKLIPVATIDGKSLGALSKPTAELMNHLDEFLKTCNGVLTPVIA